MSRLLLGVLLAAQLGASAPSEGSRGGWLGVRMTSRAFLERALRNEVLPDYLMAIPQPEKLLESWKEPGVLVVEVLADTPAERAGLFPGDVIIELNGIRVESPTTLSFLMRRAVPERMATLTLLRDGERREIYFEVGARKKPSEDEEGKKKAASPKP
jgi:S1-C subfamily serine protease